MERKKPNMKGKKMEDELYLIENKKIKFIEVFIAIKNNAPTLKNPFSLDLYKSSSSPVYIFPTNPNPLQIYFGRRPENPHELNLMEIINSSGYKLRTYFRFNVVDPSKRSLGK